MSEKEQKNDAGVITTEKEHVERTAERVRELTTVEYHELFELLRTPKKLMWLNFLIGLSRGIGLAVGLTVLGAILIAFLTVTLRKMISVPVVGEYIAEIVKLVRANTGH